ncbi:MAG: serine hydrolase, partial [Candidatus Solibacter usitatus]|nr:serine hydrolase [Candidatus Solibacter usitatus]
SDLARFAAEIWRASRGEGGSVLQPGAARLMLTPQMGNYGLGLTLQGSGDDLRFGHGGSNRGYQYLWELNAATGDGFVMMTNSGAGQRLFGGVREKAAQEFRWRQ